MLVNTEFFAEFSLSRINIVYFVRSQSTLMELTGPIEVMRLLIPYPSPYRQSNKGYYYYKPVCIFKAKSRKPFLILDIYDTRQGFCL